MQLNKRWGVIQLLSNILFCYVLVIEMLLLLLLTLGITIDLSQSIPEECRESGYKNLAGKPDEHRIIHFKPSENDDMRSVHDKTNTSKTLFEKYWFRFRLLNGTRMLEVRDLDQQFFARNETEERASVSIADSP